MITQNFIHFQSGDIVKCAITTISRVSHYTIQIVKGTVGVVTMADDYMQLARVDFTNHCIVHAKYEEIELVQRANSKTSIVPVEEEEEEIIGF